MTTIPQTTNPVIPAALRLERSTIEQLPAPILQRCCLHCYRGDTKLFQCVAVVQTPSDRGDKQWPDRYLCRECLDSVGNQTEKTIRTATGGQRVQWSTMDKPTLRALGQNPDGLSIKEILPLIGLTPDDIDYQNCLRKILDSLLLQGKIVKLQVRRGRSNPLIYALVQDAKRIEAGQSRQEKLLLRLVSNNPGASISTIRRKTGFGSKSVTDLLTNLANRGLIKREVGGRYANRSSKSGLWYKYYVNSER